MEKRSWSINIYKIEISKEKKKKMSKIFEEIMVQNWLKWKKNIIFEVAHSHRISTSMDN